MDFELSEDQLALRSAAADLLDSLAGSEQVREVADKGGDRFDRRLWAAMAEQGWPAVEVAADGGGLDLGTVEMSVLSEQVGRHLAPVPLHGTVLCSGALDRARRQGSVTGDEIVAGHPLGTWSDRLSAGESVGAAAWSGRLEALSATESGGLWRLSGRSDPAVYLPVADITLAPAVTTDGPALFALSSTGVTAEPAMDLTRSVGSLVVDGAPAIRLGGADAVEALLDRAATALCAEMLGAAERVLHMTVDYAKDRVQFGRPIGSFQAVKHRCADMLVDVEGMRSSAYYAAWAVGADDPDSSAAASSAKVWCTDASRRVMASALQVHGGIGFTWEHDLHLFVKRAQLDQVSFGDGRLHRDRLARILRPRAEAGLPVL